PRLDRVGIGTTAGSIRTASAPITLPSWLSRSLHRSRTSPRSSGPLLCNHTSELAEPPTGASRLIARFASGLFTSKLTDSLPAVGVSGIDRRRDCPTIDHQARVNRSSSELPSTVALV